MAERTGNGSAVMKAASGYRDKAKPTLASEINEGAADPWRSGVRTRMRPPG